MGSGYILSIDCGTQSIRALLFDKEGTLAAKEKMEFEPYYSVNPGWSEQDADLYWINGCTVLKRLKENHADMFDEILAVTVTTQRDTCVNVDDNGRLLRPAILWLDQRMAKCENNFNIADAMMFHASGMTKAAEISSKKSKSNWIRENQPEIWTKTYKYLLLSGYFVYRLTGRFADSTASQIGHIPFDYKNKNWPRHASSYRWRMFGVEKEKLPELVEAGEIIGEITKKAAEETGLLEGMAVIAAGSDKGCETLGTGCLDLESASISFGTTATVQSTSNRYFEPISFMPAYPAPVPSCFNPEIEIFRGYWMISWFKKEFASREMLEAESRGISPETVLNETLEKIPPGSQGLLLQPYWGAGLKMPEAKGAIIGFGDVHTRAHIYRAIIEGINYALLDGIEKIEKKGGSRIKRIMVSGGGSQSDAICQITADMLNRPVCRGQTHETSGLGAAICGFVGIGEYKSYREAVDNMVHYCDIFEPDAKNAEIYKGLYNKVYKKIYPRLKGLYKQIRDITGYPEI